MVASATQGTRVGQQRIRSRMLAQALRDEKVTICMNLYFLCYTSDGPVYRIYCVLSVIYGSITYHGITTHVNFSSHIFEIIYL